MNPWKRKGFFYKVTLVYDLDGHTVTIHRSLDFIAYHLIKRYHGEDHLIKMANHKLLIEEL